MDTLFFSHIYIISLNLLPVVLAPSLLGLFHQQQICICGFPTLFHHSFYINLLKLQARGPKNVYL